MSHATVELTWEKQGNMHLYGDHKNRQYKGLVLKQINGTFEVTLMGHRISCLGKKPTLEQAKELLELTNLKPTTKWCRCGEEEGEWIFLDDGECECGIHKHHYHCSRCGKVLQVG